MRRGFVTAVVLVSLVFAHDLFAGGAIVGKRAPDFSGKQVSGEPLSLSRLVGKTPVILTFWSIYCKSCTEEMLALQRLYEKYGPGKIAVVAVNEDGDVGLGRVRNFLERFTSSKDGGKLTIPLFFDEKGEVFAKYSVLHLPTLIYIDRDGTVREFIEGYESGRELSVFSAIEKLIGSISPEPLKEVASEVVYELDLSVPICGVYRDGKWYRPLDLDESGRPEAIARARAEGEEVLRREALRLALSQIGYSLEARENPVGCFSKYGLEIRTPVREKDPIDMLLERLNLPRILEVASQETVEQDRRLVLYRRIRVQLNALKEQLDADGYSPEKSVIRIRFVRSSALETRAFLEAVRTGFPYLSSLQKDTTSKGGEEYVLVSQAAAEKVVEKLQAMDVGPQKLSVELLPGNIAEVAMWR